jgi:hypothetical protein
MTSLKKVTTPPSADRVSDTIKNLRFSIKHTHYDSSTVGRKESSQTSRSWSDDPAQTVPKTRPTESCVDTNNTRDIPTDNRIQSVGHDQDQNDIIGCNPHMLLDNRTKNAGNERDGLSVTFSGVGEGSSRTTSYQIQTNQNRSEDAYANADDDELVGFIPASKRAKLSAVFVAGILIKNQDIDQTVKCIKTYLEKKNCSVTSVRKIKQSGVSLSVKIDLRQCDAEKLVNSGFWPDGICSRNWIN